MNSWTSGSSRTVVLTLDFQSDVHLFEVGYHGVGLGGTTHVQSTVFQCHLFYIQIVIDHLVAWSCWAKYK